MMPEIIPDPEHWGNPPDLATVQAERIAELEAENAKLWDALAEVHDLTYDYRITVLGEIRMIAAKALDKKP